MLDHHDEFGRDIVEPILQQLVDASVAKHNLLSRLCYRRGRVPRLRPSSNAIPIITVEQRSLASYDEAAV